MIFGLIGEFESIEGFKKVAVTPCSVLWGSCLLRFGCEFHTVIWLARFHYHSYPIIFCLKTDQWSFSSNQDASNQWGWTTAAVIPELENELALLNSGSYQKVLHRLMLLEDLLIENEVSFEKKFSVHYLFYSVLSNCGGSGGALRMANWTWCTTRSN